MARAKAAAVRSRGLALAALFIGALLAVAQGAAVRKLTDGAPAVALDTFEHQTQAATGQTAGVWFVGLFAPWCGHCKQLKPIWEKLAAELEGEVAVAEVDATSSKGVLTRFAEAGLVRGYPTLLLFRDGKVFKFEGGRNLETLATFARESYKQSTGHEVPPPPSAVKRAVLFVSDLAERTGMTLVPLVKRVVQSRVYRGLKQLPRRNDPRGLTLLTWATKYPDAAGALAGAAALALGTLFVLYRLLYGQTRPAAAARAPRAKRD